MTDMDMKNKTGAQIFKETMDKRQPLQTVVGANSRCSASAGSVPRYEGKFKAGYTEEQKRLAYEIWDMLEDGKPLDEVNRKRCELNRMLSQNEEMDNGAKRN